MTTTPDALLAAIRGIIGTIGVDASRGLTRTETADLFSVLDRLDTHMTNGGTAPRDWRGVSTIDTSHFEQDTTSLYHSRYDLPPGSEEQQWHTT